MEYKIGTFILWSLGLTAMGSSNPRSLRTKANIINDEGSDIVVLQAK